MTRVLVAGAGAMGSLMGAKLATGGADVTLYDIDAAHMRAVEADGLRVVHANRDDEVVALAATDDSASLGQVDIVLVMTKSWATTEAVAAVAHTIGPETWVVSAQNGLGNGARIAAVVPERQVMPGTTTVGATMLHPGVVEASGTVTQGTSLTQFGAPDGVSPTAAGVVADLFTAAGLHTEVLDDVDQVLWTKLAMAGTAGCLTALARITIGDMVTSEDAMATWRAMLDEVFAVAGAEGVTLDEEAVAAHALATYRAVGPHWASMAVDIRERRRTEVDAMCGEVARLGSLHGVLTPVNATVADLIRAVEASWSAT